MYDRDYVFLRESPMRRILTCLIVVVTVPRAWAGDRPELSPLTEQPATAIVVGAGFSRPNRLDVWQYYAVDRAGFWRPRVVLGAPEPFYLYNGAPYPLLPVKPREMMTYILD
jgi:hypothetical protein